MINIPILTVNEDFVTVFSEEDFPQHVRGGMNLTERIDALIVPKWWATKLY